MINYFDWITSDIAWRRVVDTWTTSTSSHWLDIYTSRILYFIFFHLFWFINYWYRVSVLNVYKLKGIMILLYVVLLLVKQEWFHLVFILIVFVYKLYSFLYNTYSCHFSNGRGFEFYVQCCQFTSSND